PRGKGARGAAPHPRWPHLLLEARHLAPLCPEAAFACLREAWEEGTCLKLAPGGTTVPADSLLAAADAAGVHLPQPLGTLLDLHERLMATAHIAEDLTSLDAWRFLDEVGTTLNVLDMTPVPDEVRLALARRLS
ncbi:MAG TPA: hypothetical protein VNZ52_15275, partial [Candidatus Thermoplasmatota archaeon]|nr:hypothetical protein [Candidatus Thermoplasmatota archaeon]